MPTRSPQCSAAEPQAAKPSQREGSVCPRELSFQRGKEATNRMNRKPYTMSNGAMKQRKVSQGRGKRNILWWGGEGCIRE